MRSQGEYMLKLLKTRNSDGVGKIVMLRWNPISLRISDLEDTRDKLEFNRNIPSTDKPKKKDLLNLMNT
jgi:hypothetical protein